eukprot:TRINITY_DN4795_c0_g3_i1.p1 TRINITY_DN4795_c0_g3~~TRINITY_DN4795_c0_g3_i1.p1  ORF type:complete len:333 (+),score=58.89 TRINITY_DN4795_c0_g3_i1:112-1110(+)
MFRSEEECLSNCTNLIRCTSTPAGWDCVCSGYYAANTLCKESTFSLYPLPWGIYSAMGYLLVLPAVFFVIVEMYLQYKETTYKKQTFLGKFFLLLFGICRIYHFSSILYLSFKQREFSTALAIVNNVIFWLGVVLGIITFLMSIIMWFNLILSLSHLSSESSREFKLSKRIFVVVTVVFAPVGIVLAGLIPLGDVFFVVYVIFIAIPVIISVLFCFIQVCRLHALLSETSLSDDLKNTFLRKNYLLGSISILMFLAIACLVVFFIFYEKSRNDLIYVVGSYVVRGFEIALYYLFIGFYQVYLEKWTTTAKSTTSQTKNIKSGKSVEHFGYTH